MSTLIFAGRATSTAGDDSITLGIVKRIELYYDFSCPYAYLASTQIEAIAARTGAELLWKPMLLGGIFKALGAPEVPAMPPPKARLNLLDMHRWASWFNVPFQMPLTHPNRTVLALRAALASGDDLVRASHALFRAYWAEARDLSRPEVVRAALDGAGLDGEALLRRAGDADIKDDLRRRTDEAVSRGVFGAPTMFVTNGGEPEVFWGQDRLHFVEKALGGTLPPPAAEQPLVPGREVRFFYDLSSPFAYLASTQIEAVARRAGATVRFSPFLLGALFKEIGTPNVPLLAMPEPKRLLAGKDMMRWADHHGVPLRFPSRFPMNTVKALRILLEVKPSEHAPLMHALYRAYWADDRDIGSDAELSAIAGEVGLDGAALVEAAKGEAAKQKLRDATDEAARAGLCGAPSFLVGDLLFWGQDRLAFVERALCGWRPQGE